MKRHKNTTWHVNLLVFSVIGLALLISALLAQGVNAAEGRGTLESDFVNPPEETKPWCYWYWLNGDITKDGITKDLEAMAKVGIKCAMIGNVSMEDGPVKMFSLEWYDATRHAFREANRLSIELMHFNAPGWSQSDSRGGSRSRRYCGWRCSGGRRDSPQRKRSSSGSWARSFRPIKCCRAHASWPR